MFAAFIMHIPLQNFYALLPASWANSLSFAYPALSLVYTGPVRVGHRHAGLMMLLRDDQKRLVTIFHVQASIAARVRRLEMAIPGLREKLAPEGSFSRSTGHNVMGRVEMLEDALELLLTAQVRLCLQEE